MKVEWSNRALDEAEKLDARLRRRVFEAVDRFAETGHGDVRKLAGAHDHYRLRVGQHRVRFIYDDAAGERSIVVLRVLPRDRAYRDSDD